jgi:N-acetylglucosamine kinase-like BadF-type ATPase
MILIADSGSTCTNWALLSVGHVEQLVTNGMNPITTPGSELESSLQHLVLWQQQHICQQSPTQLFFYGAGCGNQPAVERLQTILNKFFPSTKITIEGDLLAACRAACNHQAGRVGILGTGSNACHYDGERILLHQPSLGYLLGDEGSGNHLGRLLIKGYLSGTMPLELRTIFHDTYHLGYTQIIDHLYRQPDVNRFLAGFVPFAAGNQEHPYINNLLHTAFAAFLSEQVTPLQQSSLPLSIVGGVAFQFQEEIKDICRQKEIPLGKILKDPMDGLIRYHLMSLTADNHCTVIP